MDSGKTLYLRVCIPTALTTMILGLSSSRAASRTTTCEINAYSSKTPPTPARAKDRWVKVWRDRGSWRIAWSAAVVQSSRKGRTKFMRLDIKGRVDRVGEGEIGAVNIGGRGKAQVVDKVEHDEKAIYFEAPLTRQPRSISFESTAEKLRFSFIVDGRREPQEILIGEKGESPKTLPFTLAAPEISDEGRRARRRRRRR